jgi:membrane-associated phospholipid phosphatase
MAFALVYGGEHYVTDILAGWAMAAAAFALVQGAVARALPRIVTRPRVGASVPAR